MQHIKGEREIASTVQRYERQGLSLERALLTIVTDPAAGWFARGRAGRVLAIADGAAVARQCLEQFFSEKGKIALWRQR